MKQITFEELQKAVAHIDYIRENSYPVVFHCGGKKFECGIPCTTITVDKEEVLGDFQYLGVYDENEILTILDLQDVDMMEYEKIGEMLRNKCGITDDTAIMLDEEESFNEKECHIENNELPNDFILDVRRMRSQDKIQEVKEWLAAILDCRIDMLSISVKKGEILDTSNLTYFDFRFLFDKKVLYYDNQTNILSTYCPCPPAWFKKGRYKRLSSNDQFRWIYLCVIDKEYDMMGEIPVYVKIEEYGKETKWITGINKQRMIDAINHSIDQLTSLTAEQSEGAKRGLLSGLNSHVPEEARVTIDTF